MKPGSLVVIKPFSNFNPSELAKKNGWTIKWIPIDDESTIYTVRDISPITSGVKLEEGIIGYGSTGSELGVNIEYVKEIQPPMEISTFVEECIKNPPVKELELA